MSRSRRSQIDHQRSEEHTSELQSPCNLVCRLLHEKKKTVCRDASAIGANIRSRHRILSDPVTVENGMEDLTRTSLVLHQQRGWQRGVEMSNEANQYIRGQVHDRSKGELVGAIEGSWPEEFFFFHQAEPTEIYTLSLRDALPI